MKKLLFLIFLLAPLVTTATEPSLLINELAWMGTEISANDEWLELYNQTANGIDLAGWTLKATDGSPEINLTGIIPANGYFLLERTDDETIPNITADQIYTGSLGNAGEWLKLYDPEGKMVDEINATAGWPGGDNTTKQTLERSNQTDWQTSAEPGGTPKIKNSDTTSPTEPPTEEETPPAEETDQPLTGAPATDSQAKAQKGDIIFTEIFPNPTGPDTELEFIEIKNVSPSSIDLTGWLIKNTAKQTFTLPSLKMTPQSIVIFYRPQTNLALNNNKDKVTLYSQSNLIISQAEYKSPAPEGQSYQNNYGEWYWGEITPGQDNTFENEVLPQAEISGPKEAKVGEIITFDASDSFDPKNRELNFFWNFGDGRTDTGVSVRQIYLKPKTYEVLLTVATSQEASSTEKFKIKIIGEEKEASQPTSTPTTTPSITTLAEIPFIFISEFLPNPKGSDEAEFIELFSNHDKPVNLAGWKLDDAEGGSKPYLIPEGTIIKPGQYLAFFRTETKIALNNSDEAVRLIAPDGTLVDYTDYEESKEGVSFVLDEQFSWQQSQTPTPGEINMLDTSDVKQETSEQETTSTLKILGAEIKEKKDSPAGEPKNKIKYLVSAISAMVILGVGTGLKLKKRI